VVTAEELPSEIIAEALGPDRSATYPINVFSMMSMA
jgi:hypothetical protein